MQYFSLSCAAATAVILAWTDRRSGHMPNTITLTSLALAWIFQVGVRGHSGAAEAGLGTILVAGVPALLFHFTAGNAVGGGDVKALAAIGAWLGPDLGLEAELFALTLLAIFMVLRATSQGKLGSLLRNSCRPGKTPASERHYVRFGPYLATGTLLSVVSAATPPWLLWWIT